MARLLVYDAYENKVYTYSSLNENDPMPYSTGTTLTVREFRGRSNSPVLWTTIAAMEAWNLTRRKYGRGIPVGYAFRRIWEGGHGTRSQHYAGVSFDVGQSLTRTARTAIYCWAVARHFGGKFLLRIEDTDMGRYVDGAVEIIYRTLRDCGLDYDEGPDVGGDYGPYVQSERKDIYLKYARRLVEQGDAYYCFCTKERLEEMHDKGATKYDKHCLHLPKEEVERRIAAGEPYVIRQRIPKDGTTTLVKDTDYTVSCTDTYVGPATLTITGKGNYTGTNTANFNIVAAEQTPTFTTPVDLAKGGHMLDLRDFVSGAKGNVTFTIASGTAATLSGHTLTSTGITGAVTIKVSITANDVNGDSTPEYNAYTGRKS